MFTQDNMDANNLYILVPALLKTAEEDFQFKAKHKNPEGGLSEAGRKAYNRATGGDLKRPQPEGGSRRDSFCARMKGMKKKLTSAETARDPDSRINKSLRKWKCSSDKSAGLLNFLKRQTETNEQIPSVEQLYPFNPKAKLDLDQEFIKYTKPWTDYTFENIKNKKRRVNPEEADDLIFTHIEQPLAANLISIDEAQRRLNLVRYGAETPVKNWTKIKDFRYEDELLPPMAIASNDSKNFQAEIAKRQYLMDAIRNKEEKKEASAIKLLSAAKEAAKRCWKGYEPVPGKKPYSDDSCRLISAKRKKTKSKD